MSLPAAGLSPARYGREALHAEWTKLRTVASTGWLLLGAAALIVAVSAAADAAATCPSGGCQADPARLSLTGVQAGQAIVAVFAVLAISNEYSTGMIRITLTAMPRRLMVLAAKDALVAGMRRRANPQIDGERRHSLSPELEHCGPCFFCWDHVSHKDFSAPLSNPSPFETNESKNSRSFDFYLNCIRLKFETTAIDSNFIDQHLNLRHCIGFRAEMPRELIPPGAHGQTRR